MPSQQLLCKGVPIQNAISVHQIFTNTQWQAEKQAKETARMGNEHREVLKCTFQKQEARLRLLSTIQAPWECAELDLDAQDNQNIVHFQSTCQPEF